MYKNFTQQQLDKAYNTDLIEFLNAYMGFDFTKKGKHYMCKQHDSLIVYGNRKGFFWNSRHEGGGGAVDFLQKFEGMSFLEAVETIIGEHVSVSTAEPYESKSPQGEVVLPEKATGKYSRVFAYLSQTRGLSAEVISDFMKSKQLYQDKKGNCVFVGYDENGVARFGSVRGTLTLTEKKYRGDCKNSDKRYAFSQIGTDTTRLYIFEAPIDLMSHCTRTDQDYGVGAYKKQTRITLCGTSDVALEAFLERHPEVRVLNFRLDNDDAGKQAVKKYKEKYEARGYVVNAVFSENKDINEDLIKRRR